MAGLLASSLPTRAPPALGRAGRPSCRPLAARRLAQPPRGLFGGNKEGGGGGNPFANMGGLMENMRKAQEEAARVQKELSDAEFEGFSACETVRVVMTGSQEPRSVDITEEAYAQGADALASLVEEAMKDAHAKSVEGMKTRMREMASNLGIGGLGGMGM